MSQNNITPITAADPTVWHINGHELTLDIQDADTAERYEDAFHLMAEEEKHLPKDGKHSAWLRAYCGMFRNLYNRIFGDGADMKILGEKDNTRIATETYEAFLNFIAAQQEPLAALQNRVINQFSPNRAQRRAATKGKN